jgi:hypothetical protein
MNLKNERVNHCLLPAEDWNERLVQPLALLVLQRLVPPNADGSEKKQAFRLAVHNGTDRARTPKLLSGARRVPILITCARQGTRK